MKAYGEVEAYLQMFLTLALEGEEWLASLLGLFNRRKTTTLPHLAGHSASPSCLRPESEHRFLDHTGEA